MTTPIVSAEWLFSNIERPQLIILDASQYDVTDFEKCHIPGARFFDLKNDFCDKTAEFPNTIPSPEQFEYFCKQLGINNSSEIVIYDNKGIYSSPRAWWLFKTMGFDNVSVLDGGLPAWNAQGYDIASGNADEYELGDFKVKLRPEMVKDYNFMLFNPERDRYLVLDARSSGRFSGIAPEPRKELRSGHIPNSFNIPYKDVLREGKFKSKEELKEIFGNLIIDDRPLVFSCGSGITACIIFLASELIMENPKSVYDGSWTEWATKKGLMEVVA